MGSSSNTDKCFCHLFYLGRNLHCPIKPLILYCFYLFLLPQPLTGIQNPNLSKITFKLNSLLFEVFYVGELHAGD